jgi:bacterioferritin
MVAVKSKGKEAVLEVLNKARAAELAAIHQYMSQHYELANQDYGLLAAQLKLIAIDEMRHAEMFAERILVLGGEPTSAPDRPAKKGLPPGEVMVLDRSLEDEALRDYNEFQRLCRENRDSISARLFEIITEEEQLHRDYFDNEEQHLRELGASYLAKIAGSPAEAGPPARGFVAARGGKAG